MDDSMKIPLTDSKGSVTVALLMEHKRLRESKVSGKSPKSPKSPNKRGHYLKAKKRCPRPCGKEFKPRIRTQVHCSVQCRNRASQQAYRQRLRKLKAA